MEIIKLFAAALLIVLAYVVHKVNETAPSSYIWSVTAVFALLLILLVTHLIFI